MKIGIFVLILIVVAAAVIMFISRAGKVECNTDSDCVPKECCHPVSCVAKDSAPSCSGIACTLECRPATMDCGQGKCLCQNNKCISQING